MSTTSRDILINQWETIGAPAFTRRVIDIINQCRYLASKKGMSIKELRKSLRDDDARQRKLIRQSESASQLRFVSPTGVMDHANGSFCSPWFTNGTNRGMLYSQCNVPGYGQDYTKNCGDRPEINQRLQPSQLSENSRTKHRNCKSRCNLGVEGNGSSEENLMEQEPPESMLSLTSSGDDDEALVNLLYSANVNSRNRFTSQHQLYQDPRNYHDKMSGFISPENALKSRQASNLINPLSTGNPFLECSLPVRKMASHDLSHLAGAAKGDEDISILKVNSDYEKSDDDDFCESEIEVIEDLDVEKKVVSPLIKKAESAFADLQKKDSLFGNQDDFGILMSQAHRIF